MKRSAGAADDGDSSAWPAAKRQDVKQDVKPGPPDGNRLADNDTRLIGVPSPIQAMWHLPLCTVLEDYRNARMRVRWDAMETRDKADVMGAWGKKWGAAKAVDFLLDALEKGDLEMHLGNPQLELSVRHEVKLRAAPARDAPWTGAVLEKQDDYVVLEAPGDFFRIRTMHTGVEGHILRHKSVLMDKVPAFFDERCVDIEDDTFGIDSLTTFPMPAGLRRLLLLRVQQIELSLGNSFVPAAYHRRVFMEGRTVKYGSKPGGEITDSWTKFSPLTSHILKLINYPLKGPEPWRNVSVVWNKYTDKERRGLSAGDGTMRHKNWGGTQRTVYLRFGEPGSSCRFTFFDKWSGKELETRRINSAIMCLGAGVDAKYLHQIADIKGTHYSMVIRELSDDWEDWREWKQAGGAAEQVAMDHTEAAVIHGEKFAEQAQSVKDAEDRLLEWEGRGLYNLRPPPKNPAWTT
eukprot:TRINITY_DN27663_c0_g1_i1.p1 TRINITY_DN27663_c0_g1~~TRINITY_DN27663_c0_g1_i1.p1  ORF type:complete len:462 (+),score=143.46 TRINITY_DN27663_c0_g1_i1:65-1450(+)